MEQLHQHWSFPRLTHHVMYIICLLVCYLLLAGAHPGTAWCGSCCSGDSKPGSPRNCLGAAGGSGCTLCSGCADEESAVYRQRKGQHVRMDNNTPAATAAAAVCSTLATKRRQRELCRRCPWCCSGRVSSLARQSSTGLDWAALCCLAAAGLAVVLVGDLCATPCMKAIRPAVLLQ